MPGLWRNNEETSEGKYLVTRRDGTVPEWPYFVIGAKDAAVPLTLKVYAIVAFLLGYEWQYVKDVWKMSGEFAEYRKTHGNGDPDAPRHREDDPATIEKMRGGFGA